MTQSDAAQTFRALHRDGLLILPNAWDAGSARVIEHAGAKAIATSSAAVAWAHGYPDGEAVTTEMLLSTIRCITRVVGLPVSADIEAGYATDPEAAGAFAARIVDAGAVGVNVEDGNAAPDVLVQKITHIKRATAAAGGGLWVNARIDVYLRKLKEGEAAYAETIARARRYREAGADSIFVPGVADEQLISKLVRDIELPLNLLVWPALPAADRLQQLGVRRLSAGAGIARVALNQVHSLASTFLKEGRSEPFAQGNLGSPQLNALMRRT